MNSVSPSVEQITIEPDGRWVPVEPGEKAAGPHGRDSDDDDDDDELVMIPDHRVDAIKRENGLDSAYGSRTPPARESVGAAASARSSASASSNKRSSAVVDLTLSDDDEPAARAAKRPYGTPAAAAIAPAGLGMTQLSEYLGAETHGQPRLESGTTFRLLPSPSPAGHGGAQAMLPPPHLLDYPQYGPPR